MDEANAHLGVAIIAFFPALLFLSIGFAIDSFAGVFIGGAAASVSGYHWREYWRRRGVVLKRRRRDWE